MSTQQKVVWKVAGQPFSDLISSSRSGSCGSDGIQQILQVVIRCAVKRQHARCDLNFGGQLRQPATVFGHYRIVRKSVRFAHPLGQEIQDLSLMISSDRDSRCLHQQIGRGSRRDSAREVISEVHQKIDLFSADRAQDTLQSEKIAMNIRNRRYAHDPNASTLSTANALEGRVRNSAVNPTTRS